MKIGVLLSGCGVYDGAEIHESVLTLLAIEKLGATPVCIAPDVMQYHVVNHLTGDGMPEQRNVLVEAARIARGNIRNLAGITPAELDGLAIPGGFGAAKNFTEWAFSGPEGSIMPEVKRFVVRMVRENKPIAALCMAPVVVAKALQGSAVTATLSVGTTEEPSPYDIAAISEGINATGAKAVYCDPTDVVVDDINNIVTSPCYMMESSIVQINEGIEKTISKLVELITLLKSS